MLKVDANIGVVGCGRMGSALVKGFIDKRVAVPASIYGYDVFPAAQEKLKEELGIHTELNVAAILRNCKIIIIAIKPQQFDDFLLEHKNQFDHNHLVISIAAGVTLTKLESSLSKSQIIRVMPNLPLTIGCGASGYMLGKKVSEKNAEIVKRLLETVGVAYEVDQESDLDAVTALSGSGPAYVAYFINSMVQKGIELGLNEDIALQLSLQTFVGTARFLQDQNIIPEKFIDMVKSPGGTTEAAMGVLEQSEIKVIISQLMQAAFNRSKELGR